MSRHYRLVTIGVGLFLLAATAMAANTAVATAQDHVVRVYYFHTTQRCASCKKIEALSAEAIRAGFERELGDGRLEWQVVNTDDSSNKHFVDDYKLYTKSVIVVDRVNGQQVRWKNLPKVWELLQDEKGFRLYVQSEVQEYLEKRP